MALQAATEPISTVMFDEVNGCSASKVCTTGAAVDCDIVNIEWVVSGR